MLSKCTQTKAEKGFKASTKFNFIAVEKNNVPSEPAINLQKLNFSSASLNGLLSANKSKAYPVFLLGIDFLGKLASNKFRLCSDDSISLA
ncbi:hypothetical protein D3C80_1215000 [compost metagenome]